LRELSARLQSVREEERIHIDRVIHDELGQTLTGLKMDVAWLQRHLDRQQLQEFQTRSGIQGKLISAPEETTLDADGATAAFRIFQEILTNVARRAQATQGAYPGLAGGWRAGRDGR
jgi:signal transduction histidine kinase